MNIIKCASMPNISATSEPIIRSWIYRQIEMPAQIDRLYAQHFGHGNRILEQNAGHSNYCCSISRVIGKAGSR